MFSQEVTDKDGNKRNVIGADEAEVKDTAKAVSNQTAATYPNINKPVKKGHDLIDVDGALNVNLVDGTGAHNSPRDAIRDDGTVEGDPKVPLSSEDEPDRLKAGTGEPADSQKSAPKTDEGTGTGPADESQA